mmetsp:Transcript_23671/g.76970  ORF Transcript_23671/g.76970 Transcript_23671/m.76970 type:complete len:234 (-) Transcript_23671:2189-2890(-)
MSRRRRTACRSPPRTVRSRCTASARATATAPRRVRSARSKPRRSSRASRGRAPRRSGSGRALCRRSPPRPRRAPRAGVSTRSSASAPTSPPPSFPRAPDPTARDPTVQHLHPPTRELVTSRKRSPTFLTSTSVETGLLDERWVRVARAHSAEECPCLELHLLKFILSVAERDDRPSCADVHAVSLHHRRADDDVEIKGAVDAEEAGAAAVDAARARLNFVDELARAQLGRPRH